MRTEKNYYELLGVSGDSEPREIKEAYRKLQKKYHPDIAGQEVIFFPLKFSLSGQRDGSERRNDVPL